jgi:RNA polymerase primary sigma factor
MDDVQRSDVQLSATEIDRINEASDRARRRSDELRSRLAGSAGTPDTGTGEYIAGALARDRGVQVEAELARAAKAGDAAAIDELVQRSMPLVVGAARRHAVGGLELADLIQEGTAALLRALERYDPDRGVPFSAYSRRRVHRALDDLLREFVRPARLSRKDLRELSRLRSERDRLYARTGREPTVEELAELVGVDPRRARELLWLDAPPRSLYDPVVLDEEDALGRHPVEPLEDLLPDPWSTDYDELVDRVASEQLRGLLSRLTAREQEIVTAYYGLDGRRPEGLEDIAERLGMSVYRVRRLERQALAKLRQQALAAAAEQGLEPEGSRRESSGPESEHEAAEPDGSGLGSAGPGSEHDRADREGDRSWR